MTTALTSKRVQHALIVFHRVARLSMHTVQVRREAAVVPSPSVLECRAYWTVSVLLHTPTLGAACVEQGAWRTRSEVMLLLSYSGYIHCTCSSTLGGVAGTKHWEVHRYCVKCG